VLRFTADPSTQTELERVLKLADEVIRHKILHAPPAAKAAASKTDTAEPSPAPA
jgi:ribosomal protein S6